MVDITPETVSPRSGASSLPTTKARLTPLTYRPAQGPPCLQVLLFSAHRTTLRTGGGRAGPGCVSEPCPGLRQQGPARAERWKRMGSAGSTGICHWLPTRAAFPLPSQQKFLELSVGSEGQAPAAGTQPTRSWCVESKQVGGWARPCPVGVWGRGGGGGEAVQVRRPRPFSLTPLPRTICTVRKLWGSCVIRHHQQTHLIYCSLSLC